MASVRLPSKPPLVKKVCHSSAPAPPPRGLLSRIAAAEPVVYHEPVSSDEEDNVVDSRAEPPVEPTFLGVLTEEKLQEITGFDDLDLVESCELRVDSLKTPNLSMIGATMVSLRQLCLSHSTLPSLRDLGTGCVRLRVLWLSNSHVDDIDGIQFCHQLQELYIPFNNIKALGPLSSLSNLEVLDLEANQVADVAELDCLAGLDMLSSITLTGNPIENSPAFRTDVKLRLPNLKTLDEADVEAAKAPCAVVEDGNAGDALALEAAEAIKELEYLNESIKQNRNVGMDVVIEENHRSLYSRQATASAAARRRPPTIPVIIETASKISSAPQCSPQKQQASSGITRRKVHSSEESPKKGVQGASATVSSVLTSGGSGVFTGSVSSSLRATRRSRKEGDGEDKKSPPPSASAGPSSDPQAEGGDAPMDAHCATGNDNAGLFEKYVAKYNASNDITKLKVSKLEVVGAVHAMKASDVKEMQSDLLLDSAGMQERGDECYESIDPKDLGGVEEDCL